MSTDGYLGPPGGERPPTTGRVAGRPRGQHWSVGTDVHLLSLMHRQQAKLYRDEQSAIRRRLQRSREENAEHEMSAIDAEKLSNINTFLAKATQAMLDLNDARDTLRQSTPTDVLLEQLRHEFAAAAKSFTADELVLLGRNLRREAFDVLDRVRIERFGEAVPA
jgi:hypothetical protein